MSYTKEEVASMKENFTKIRDYVFENYVPKLRRYENISVKFGAKSNPFGHEKGKDLSFGFNTEGDVWFRTGDLVLYFNPEHTHNVYTSYSYAIPLLLNWKSVKELIETELMCRESERKALAEFEV